jgi:hypothetical protein
MSSRRVFKRTNKGSVPVLGEKIRALELSADETDSIETQKIKSNINNKITDVSNKHRDMFPDNANIEAKRKAKHNGNDSNRVTIRRKGVFEIEDPGHATRKLGTVDYVNENSIQPGVRIPVLYEEGVSPGIHRVQYVNNDKVFVDDKEEKQEQYDEDGVYEQLHYLFKETTLGLIAEDIENLYNGYCNFELIMRAPRNSGKYEELQNKSVTRSLNLPSEVSENLARFALYKYEFVRTNEDGIDYAQTSFFCPRGDLATDNNNTQIEVKGFTSDGPLSYGPTEHWDKLVFVDMRHHIETHSVKVILVDIGDLENAWKNIRVKKEITLKEHLEATRKTGKSRLKKSILTENDQKHLSSKPTMKSFKDIIERIVKRGRPPTTNAILNDILFDLKFLLEYRNIDVPKKTTKSGGMSNTDAMRDDIDTWKKILLNTDMREPQSTFEDQCKQKRRPRISFENTYEQLKQQKQEKKFTLIWDGLVSELLNPNILFEYRQYSH